MRPIHKPEVAAKGVATFDKTICRAVVKLLYAEAQNIAYGYEMDCKISSEFTPMPTMTSMLDIIEKYSSVDEIRNYLLDSTQKANLYLLDHPWSSYLLGDIEYALDQRERKERKLLNHTRYSA